MTIYTDTACTPANELETTSAGSATCNFGSLTICGEPSAAGVGGIYVTVNSCPGFTGYGYVTTNCIATNPGGSQTNYTRASCSAGPASDIFSDSSCTKKIASNPEISYPCPDGTHTGTYGCSVATTLVNGFILLFVLVLANMMYQ